jgi:hypothetical protein
LGCDQPCSSNACTDACYAKATGVAQGLFNAFTTCIDDNCPSTDGGPCASSSSSACSTCNTQAATGACVNLLLACETDNHAGPADPDGGSVVPYDAGVMEAGSSVSCGAIVSCQQGCAQGDASCLSTCLAQGTSTAQALDQALGNCVATACPAADGGPCATQGSACSGCESQANFGACASQFQACQDDTSATDGGTTAPIAEQGGTIDVLLPGLSQPQVVLIQNGNAYTSEVTSTGRVLAVSASDGGAATTISPSQPFPMGLSIDSNNIYVWNSGTFSGNGTLNNSDGTVVQIPLGGGSPTTLASNMVVAYAAPYLNAVTNDTKNVYWVSGGPGTPGAINVAPIGGASPAQVLYAGQTYPEAVVTDGTDLYWSNWGTFDAQGNYNGDGAVLKAPVGGGASPTTLASNQKAPAALALDGTNVYWTNIGQLTAGGLAAPGTGSVVQVSKGGGSPVTIASSLNIPLGIAVYGSTVYWAEFTLSAPGKINGAPVGGGSVTALVANAKDPFGLAVSGGVVFWTENVPSGVGNGALYSLTP